ncbi:MAG: VIT and VWA domain-containing protein [Planctomycetota bacterium]
MQKVTSILTLLTVLAVAAHANAAGILTATGSADAPIRIRDHHVQVTLNNGFAQTEVVQTFHNPNSRDLEAVYSFPIPRSASLAEVTVIAGEYEIAGEVVSREDARQAYEEEKQKGNDAAVAEKNGYIDFRFSVARVSAGGDVQIRFVYYQPLEIDTGVARYVYPVEEGGTDDAGSSFWTPNNAVDEHFSIAVEVKSAWPITDLRMPGYEGAAIVDNLGEGHRTIKIEEQQSVLERDFVLYYRLRDDLPGRVEVIPYRASDSDDGTFMMVVTPGLDLQPLNGGSDYVFILDVSGSMQTKIKSLARGVSKAIGELKDHDRFRVVAFSSDAREVIGWTAATTSNVQRAIAKIDTLAAGGSTNMFEGVSLGLRGLDDDRATSVVLVTDAVTNTGVVSPEAFDKLMRKFDVRVFGFLLGNSGNWPLLQLVCDASGGFSAQVSNADDMTGQLLLAKSKVTHESLHDASLRIKGGGVYDVTDQQLRKIYRGEQLVLFGRYAKPGTATVRLNASLTGADKVYETTFELPAVDTDNPEIERLWALRQIEEIEQRALIGQLPSGEAKVAVRDLGINYQLVTDETSMVVLSDQAFADRGIERRNRERVGRERTAQIARAQKPARSARVDNKKPMFRDRAPSIGGGAFDPVSLGVIGVLLGAGVVRRRLRSTPSSQDTNADQGAAA